MQRLSKLSMIAAMLMSVLSVTSCSSTQKTVSEASATVRTAETRDTTAAAIRQIRWETVPESRVEMAVSVDSLLKLPEGASYSKRNGQANIKVAAHGDTVYITGTCDSLQRQVEYYEALYHTARDALEQQHEQYQQERKQRTSLAKIALAFFIAGIISGAITTIIIITKRQKQ